MPNRAVNLSPITSQQEAINRRRALAQALQQESIAPIEMPQYPGANVSWTQGAAKLVQALVAGLQNRRLDKQQRELDTRAGAERLASALAMTDAVVPQAWGASMTLPMASYQPAAIPDTLGGGRPAEMPEPVTPEGTRTLQLPVTAEQQEQRRMRAEALARALASGDPMQQRYGEFAMQDLMARGREQRDYAADLARMQAQQSFTAQQNELNRQAQMQPRERVQTPGVDIPFPPEVLAQKLQLNPPGVPSQPAVTETVLALRAAQGDVEARKALGILQAQRPPAAPREERLVQVMGPNGKPIWVRESEAVGQPAAQAARAVTGAERQALAFFNRAQEAVTTITSPIGGGESLENKIAKSGLVQQYRGQYAPNIVQSSEQQSYRQAQRAFTEARLRKESGAAIPQAEFDNDARTYFAQPGDSQQVIEQKQKARQTVLDGLKFSSGKAYEEFYGEAGTTPGGGNAGGGLVVPGGALERLMKGGR